MDLVVVVYRLTKRFPDDERYGLTSQMRRAAVSIPSNIAEGSGRYHIGDYLRHVSVANGSLKELETQVLIARRLVYLAETEMRMAIHRSAQIGRMLAGLIRKLEAKAYGSRHR